MIAVFTLLVKWCLNMEAKYGLLFPGLYCFPLLMAAWGVESGLQQVRKPGKSKHLSCRVADPGCLSRIRFFPSQIQGQKDSGSRIRVRIKEFK
jgi:hypothetical protein